MSPHGNRESRNNSDLPIRSDYEIKYEPRLGRGLVLPVFFFFNETAPTEIYTSLHTLSLHDALPILPDLPGCIATAKTRKQLEDVIREARSEEHTSELQSRNDISYAVFCLKKKK